MKHNALLLLALGVGAILALAGINTALGLVAVFVLGLGVYLLWRPGISPVFIFIFAYQWLQASTKIFEADLLGQPVNDLAQFGGDVESAAYMSLASLAALAVGFAIPLGKQLGLRANPGHTFRLDDKPPIFWAWLYAGALAVSLLADSAAYFVPGLSQPLLALGDLKWAFYWILAHLAMQRGGVLRWIWLAAFGFELVSGVTGYFSDFKTVLFFTLFAVLSSGVRATPARLVGVTAVFALSLLMAVAWSAIKIEQRKFLSQDERAQIVSVTFEQSARNIYELASRLDGESMLQGASKLAARISYVDFFAKVLDVVPDEIPFEGGAIWGDAVVRPFMPRILFPDKSVIDDSERTSTYTNMYIMGAEEGVSISLGYVAESYIDFGPWLMYMAPFCLGWLCGYFYRWLVDGRGGHRMLNIGLASATLFQAAYLESSITKLFGGLVVSALMAWLVARYLVPMLFVSRAESVYALHK